MRNKEQAQEKMIQPKENHYKKTKEQEEPFNKKKFEIMNEDSTFNKIYKYSILTWVNYILLLNDVTLYRKDLYFIYYEIE